MKKTIADIEGKYQDNPEKQKQMLSAFSNEINRRKDVYGMARILRQLYAHAKNAMAGLADKNRLDVLRYVTDRVIVDSSTAPTLSQLENPDWHAGLYRIEDAMRDIGNSDDIDTQSATESEKAREYAFKAKEISKIAEDAVISFTQGSAGRYDVERYVTDPKMPIPAADSMAAAQAANVPGGEEESIGELLEPEMPGQGNEDLLAALDQDDLQEFLEPQTPEADEIVGDVSADLVEEEPAGRKPDKTKNIRRQGPRPAANNVHDTQVMGPPPKLDPPPPAPGT